MKDDKNHSPNKDNSLFETEEHRLAELEYEKYYNRIRMMSRGGADLS